jgi:hypothetical protein
MDKQELLSRTGSLQQLASIRPVAFTEGRSRGMSGFMVHNGAIDFTVMADKCLDIAELRFKGTNFSFLAKPGLMGRNPFDTHGAEALRSIMGGLLFTCGLENICAPCVIDGKEYPMHGRLRTTPAEHLATEARWVEDRYRLRISGEMREAELFGENLVLRRSITTFLDARTIAIRDEIENQAFRPEPLMLMYHFNIGHPLLSEACEIVIPSLKVTPRDEASRPHADRWHQVEAPRPNQPEAVFIHDLAADEHGDTFVAVINHDTGQGIQLAFNRKVLNHFMQWKSMAAGDYVIGLEPSNSSVYGKPYHHEQGSVQYLAPFATVTTNLLITLLDGEAEINAVKQCAEQLKGAHPKEK